MSARRGFPRGWWLLAIAFPFVALLLAIGGVLIAGQGGFAALHVPAGESAPVSSDAATLRRGEYLARLGNCTTCHSVRGGERIAHGELGGGIEDFQPVFTPLHPCRELRR